MVSVCDRRFFEVDIKHIDTLLATTHISAISMQGEGAEKRAEDLKTTTVQYSNRARRLKIVVHSKRDCKRRNIIREIVYRNY